MIPNPIHKVLLTLSTHRVQYLLMGGQACVLYGGAEFSRDCDVAILCEPQNLTRLQQALDELQADVIAVPPFEADYLKRGHAIHFRCHAAGVENIRLDVMATMRNVPSFKDLWQRRTTLRDDSGASIELMALPDVLGAKKTQRDKDWPMIRRLVEANYAQHHQNPTDKQIQFWLLESRTPAMLIEVAKNYPDAANRAIAQRPLLTDAISGNRSSLQRSLAEEMETEREADREYWRPLKRELEQLRRERR